MFLASALLVGMASLAAAAQAGPAVELVRWQGEAVDFPVRGPGEEQFRLRADVRWAAGAPTQPGGYAVRLRLPDGSVRTHPVEPQEGPGARRLSVLVPAASVRNLRPEAVRVVAVVVDAATGAVASNPLEATIDDFPTPKTGRAVADKGPFGWGRPLKIAPGLPAHLPRPGPDGLHFLMIARANPPGVLGIATTEATNAQVKRRLPAHDPKAGRSDEFLLEGDDQPAINLTPKGAAAYLAGLGRADRSGLVYRLPTEAEWDLAARAGRRTAFWWGDEPTHPRGANFLGPEPALPTDTTATSTPEPGPDRFEGNPWGLFHTFGNAAEWATRGRAWSRIGGHFRTEPASPLPAEPVNDPEATGPDAFVGVRPAFDLSAEAGTRLARAALRSDPRLAAVVAAFDPDRATVTLTGTAGDPAARRGADRRLAALWFVAAVENRIVTPTVPPGALALLGPGVGRPKRVTPLGRALDEVPVEVRWAEALPVAGSDWWVNIYPEGGGHDAQLLVGRSPSTSKTITILIDPTKLPAGRRLAVALSLGAAAPTPNDPRVVSNLLPLQPNRP